MRRTKAQQNRFGTDLSEPIMTRKKTTTVSNSKLYKLDRNRSDFDRNNLNFFFCTEQLD